MAFVSTTFRNYNGQAVGDGECVAYVKATARAPATSQWRRGKIVKGAMDIAEGTAIATFDPKGHYENVSGKSHAAIYVSQDANGIQVYDQWRAHPVAMRTIRFNNPGHGGSNDGDAFYVID
jgi:hypothetical protein